MGRSPFAIWEEPITNTYINKDLFIHLFIKIFISFYFSVTFLAEQGRVCPVSRDLVLLRRGARNGERNVDELHLKRLL